MNNISPASTVDAPILSKEMAREMSEFAEGSQARIDGKSITECPYSIFNVSEAEHRVLRSVEYRLGYENKFQAWKQGGVLGVLAAQGGKYSRFFFRFDEHYRAYDVRVTADADPGLLNFVVLPNSGIVASLVSDGATDRLCYNLSANLESPTLLRDFRSRSRSCGRARGR